MELARDFAQARLAQGMAAAGRVQDALVAAGVLSPGVDLRWAIALAAYAAWQLFKLTVLRRAFPAFVALFARVPRLHVPLTADEAAPAAGGKKWVSGVCEAPLRPPGAARAGRGPRCVGAGAPATGSSRPQRAFRRQTRARPRRSGARRAQAHRGRVFAQRGC